VLLRLLTCTAPEGRAVTHLVSVRYADRTECCSRRFDDLPDGDDLTDDEDLVTCPETLR
jgi:hypothetical protein